MGTLLFACLLSYCILLSTVANLEEVKYHFAYFVDFPPKKIVKGVWVGRSVPLQSVTKGNK